MARQPEVFVRELDPEQAQRLVKITRTTRDRVRLRRAEVVLASVQGRSAGEIAMMFAASENYVREVIHAFNQQGFAALDPKWSGGRPRKFGPAARDQICRIARSSPSGLGQPFTTWSLSKLVDYLHEHHRLVVSVETVRRVLRQAGITWQRTKTWKTSRDPDFAAKMAGSWISTTIRPPMAGCCVWTSSGRSTCNPGPVTAGSGAASQPGCEPPTPARTGYGRCSPHWIWPPGRCSTGSGTGNAGPSSWTSANNCAAVSRPAGCIWSATTTVRTARPRSPLGASGTGLNWSSRPTTPPG